MFPFIETIHIENYKARLLALHLSRIDQTCRETFGFGRNNEQITADILQFACSNSQKIKLSVHYNETDHWFISSAYLPKKIRKFYLVEASDLDYHLKYADRTALNNLKTHLKDDEEAIIIQAGRVTDTSFSNICFLKNGKWYTPDTPLLPGIKRRFYLETNQIKEKEIKVEDIPTYEKISLINSMLDLHVTAYDIGTISPQF